jgi:hypothetical protein
VNGFKLSKTFVFVLPTTPPSMEWRFLTQVHLVGANPFWLTRDGSSLYNLLWPLYRFQNSDMWFFPAQVLAVVILYVRCAACDPADPGVHRSRQQAASQSKKVAVSKGKPAKEFTSSDTGVEQLQDESDRSLPSTFPLKSEETNAVRGVCSYLGVCLHHLVCKKQQQSEKVNAGEQLLYCSICDAEVSNSAGIVIL